MSAGGHNGDATCCNKRAEGECTGVRRQGNSGDVLGEKREGDGDGDREGKTNRGDEDVHERDETRREVTELTDTGDREETTRYRRG